MFLRAILLISAALLLGFTKLAAQAVGPRVTYNFVKTDINVVAGQTFSNALIVINHTNSLVVLLRKKLPAAAPQPLLQIPDTITIAAGAQVIYPVKYLADQRTITSANQEFSVELSTAVAGSVTVAPQAAFSTHLAGDKGLSLFIDQPLIYIDRYTNQAKVLVRCANQGLLPVQFSLSTNAAGIGLQVTDSSGPQNLQGLSSQALLLTIDVKNQSANGEYALTIMAVNTQGQEVARRMVRILSVGSSRQYAMRGDIYNQPFTDVLGARFVRFNTNYTVVQLFAAGRSAPHEGKTIDYSFNSDYYREPNAITIYNTYVDYQDKHFGIKAGNINANLDYPLNGRGAAVTYRANNKSTVTAYAVENQYMLINRYSNGIPGIKTVALEYNNSPGADKTNRVLYLHNSYTQRKLNQNQLAWQWRTPLRNNQHLGFEAGLSQENYQQAGNPVKKAFALGMSYDVNRGRYLFTTSNYYSTPYYTGMRRGFTQSQTQFTYKLNAASSLFAYAGILGNNANDLFNAEYSLFASVRRSNVYTFELGYNLNCSKWHLTFKPYWLIQDIDPGLYRTNTSESNLWRSRAVHAALAAGYNASANNFLLQVDYGYYYYSRLNNINAPYHGLKFSGSWMSHIAGFNVLAQFNPYYLTEILSVGAGDNYRIYAFGPFVHFNALHNRLYLQANTYYNGYNFTRSNSYSFNTTAKYLLPGNWQITCDAYYNILDQHISGASAYYGPVSSNRFDTYQVRLGIEKKIDGLFSSPYKSLKLTFFEDANANGIKDDTELAAANVQVTLNGEATITNARGQSKYTRLPEGTYRVAVNNNEGWSLQEPLSINLTKSRRMDIPLVKTTPQRGSIVPVKSAYLRTRQILAGINVVALSATGSKVTTLTDEYGKFSFYLPPGSYTISVITEGMPFAILNNTQQVNITYREGAALTFNYRDESRKVEVKKF